MPRPLGSSPYLPGLDGLRTLAVAGVIWYHVHAASLPGGLLGVGVFFTLSGYLITSLLIREWEKTGTIRLGQFWLRRLRRLLPAVILVCLVVVIATIFVAPGKLGERSIEALSAIFYVNNWYEIAQGNSYFDNFAGAQPFEHMWSLSVEEQFYFVWPLLFIALGWAARAERGAFASTAWLPQSLWLP